MFRDISIDGVKPFTRDEQILISNVIVICSKQSSLLNELHCWA